ncbi:hypothetical protein KUT97_09775 [Pseudomonas aeruginosa]|nr:hypothetical protein [Pseudomonas aeruginosa]
MMHLLQSSNRVALSFCNRLIKQLYMPTPSSDGKEESYEPRPDLSFKLNLNATSLHERILKWMSAGKEGVGEINKAIQTTLRRKTNKH